MSKRIILALLACTATAHADPRSQAQGHVKAATAAYDAGNFAGALSELQLAYDLEPHPDLLYAIGQAYTKLGRCTEAAASFEKFRAGSKDPAVSDVVDQAIAACKPHDDPGATTASATTSSAPDAELPPPTKLVDEPAAPVPAPAVAAPTPPPRPSPPHDHAPWYADKVGDALVAAGVVAVVAGVVVYHGAASDLDQAEASSSLAAYGSLVDDAHSARTTSVIFFAGGSALVAAGVVRYVLHTDSDAETPSVGMVPAAHGGLVTWGGRF